MHPTIIRFNSLYMYTAELVNLGRLGNDIRLCQ